MFKLQSVGNVSIFKSALLLCIMFQCIKQIIRFRRCKFPVTSHMICDNWNHRPVKRVDIQHRNALISDKITFKESSETV